MSPSLAIIGFGAFGRLAERHLAPHVRLIFHDPAVSGSSFVSLCTAAEADIILLCVPVAALEKCLTDLAPLLHAGQTVIDCCSVKEEPARLMLALLPDFVTLIATHPMFGPQSTASGIAGLQIVLCPLRGPWRRVAAFLRRQRLRVVVTTPAEHDRQAAMTQGLTHLLARAMATLGPAPRIRTRSFDMLAQALALVGDDSPALFAAVTEGNPHVAPLRDRLITALGSHAGNCSPTLGPDGRAFLPATGLPK